MCPVHQWGDGAWIWASESYTQEPTIPQASAAGMAKEWTFLHTDVFARPQLKSPSALMQKLELDQWSVAFPKTDAEPKAILYKEELKLACELWLLAG